MHFCSRYFAWEKNWQASEDWLSVQNIDKALQQEALSIAGNMQIQQRRQWNPLQLQLCETIRHRFELYYQDHPKLVRPYPNWSVRYLGENS